MNLPTSPKERAALVRMVSASAKLIVAIGRAIADHGLEAIEDASAEFVDAVIEVQKADFDCNNPDCPIGCPPSHAEEYPTETDDDDQPAMERLL